MSDMDGWIKYDGGNCPVSPDTWVQITSTRGVAHDDVLPAGKWEWQYIAAYRVFAPVAPDQPAADIAAAGEAALRAEVEALRHDLSRIKDHETALVNEVEALQAKLEKAGRDLNVAKYGQPNFAWQVHLAAMEDLRDDRDRLAADLKVAREALAFYADPTLDGYDVMVTNYGLSTEEGAIIRDKGDIARAALAPVQPHVAAARVLLDDWDRVGGQRRAGLHKVKWGKVWDAMTAERRELDWNDWPALFLTALEQIAKDAD